MIKNARSLSDYTTPVLWGGFYSPPKPSGAPFDNLLFHISFDRTSALSRQIIGNWKYSGCFVFFFITRWENDHFSLPKLTMIFALSIVLLLRDLADFFNNVSLTCPLAAPSFPGAPDWLAYISAMCPLNLLIAQIPDSLSVFPLWYIFNFRDSELSSPSDAAITCSM